MKLHWFVRYLFRGLFRGGFSGLVGGIVACLLLQACQSTPVPLTAAAPKVETAKAEDSQEKQLIAELREENEFLGQQLRRLILSNTTTAVPATAVPAAPVPLKTAPPVNSAVPVVKSADSVPQATGYWLTMATKKRHNQKCRYYQATDGRPCGADEGIACKLCGG